MVLPAALIELLSSSPTGSLTVAQYMEWNNRHYYGTRDPLGAQGDFTTAPEISQIFGEIIGAWLAEHWIQLAKPHTLLLEMGPGRGTLMHDMLRATQRVDGFHEHLQIHLLESSPALRAIQHERLSMHLHQIRWHATFPTLPPMPLLVVANEFFDALPVHQFTSSGEERGVKIMDQALQWSSAETITRESSPDSQQIMRRLCTHMAQHGGAALYIDYGYQGVSQGDSLQAMRRHHYVHPLAFPGEADLTAHVDFDSLKAIATNTGLYASVVPQGNFLRHCGAELRATMLCRQQSVVLQQSILSGLERLMSPTRMGQLFKVLAVSSLPLA